MPGTAETIHIQMTHERIEGVAKALHRMADEVQREADTFLGRVEKNDEGTTVSNVIHTVMWGVANLNLDVLSASQTRIGEARLMDAKRAESAAKRDSE